jgi:hypothetical protein
MSGVLISVVDTKKQRERAQDAVKRSAIEKIMLASATYRSLYGSYPSVQSDPKFAALLTWPTEPSNSTYTYTVTADGENYAVYTPTADDLGVIKYHSTWRDIQTCYGASDGGATTDCTIDRPADDLPIEEDPVTCVLATCQTYCENANPDTCIVGSCASGSCTCDPGFCDGDPPTEDQ